jgi:putative ABC transport system permease protein
VFSAAVSSSFPLDPDSIAMGPMQSNFLIEGQVVREGQPMPLVSVRAGSVDYFKTLGIPLIQGRTFAATDTEKALQVADINQSLARHRFAGLNPIGKRISFDQGKTWTTIVGIVGDTREFGLDQKPDDEAYVPLDQAPAVGSLLVRTAGDPTALINEIRRAVRSYDPQTALTNVETLEDARRDTLKSPRLMANLLGLFAVLALVIAASGIGGILALSVNQRVHEIGIRLALGAEPGDVLKMVIRQGMILVLIGLGIGLLVSFWMTSPLKTLLFEISPTDSSTLAGVAALLALVAFAACSIPARRATRIDPLVALHYE